MNSNDLATKSMELGAQIRPLLAGKHAGVVSAALADMVATLLAGHSSTDDQITDAELREELLEAFVELVRTLIPINLELVEELKLFRDQRRA